jgi:hypothetical protein
MNTVKSLFVLCAMLISSIGIGQASIDPGIQATLDGFIKASNEHDWDKAFDYMYAKMFDQVSKQDLVDMMKSTEEDGMSIKVENAKITSTSVPVKENGQTFVRVDYESDMTVAIRPGGAYDHPKSTYAMKEQFENNFGTSNVRWDENKDEFKVHARKSMMAINVGVGIWKMVEINMDQPALMEYLFSDEVMDALVRVE